jgi:hypothetical protein
MSGRTVQLERCLLMAAVVVLSVALLPSCNQYRLAPLQRNVPVGAAGPSSPAAQERAIEAALANRHWAVVQKQPGRYVAKLLERVHVVTVNINYGAEGIFIDYVDSAQLMYTRDSAGRETIHRKYNTWVQNLADGIRVELARSRAS